MADDGHLVNVPHGTAFRCGRTPKGQAPPAEYPMATYDDCRIRLFPGDVFNIALDVAGAVPVICRVRPAEGDGDICNVDLNELPVQSVVHTLPKGTRYLLRNAPDDTTGLPRLLECECAVIFEGGIRTHLNGLLRVIGQLPCGAKIKMTLDPGTLITLM